MNNLLTIFEFFGGLIVLFAIGWLIGSILKLDRYEDILNDEKSKRP